MKFSPPPLSSNPLYIRVRSTEGTFCIDLEACVETWEGPKVRERCIIQGTDPQHIATEWNFVNFSTEVGGKAGNSYLVRLRMKAVMELISGFAAELFVVPGNQKLLLFLMFLHPNPVGT